MSRADRDHGVARGGGTPGAGTPRPASVRQDVEREAEVAILDHEGVAARGDTRGAVGLRLVPGARARHRAVGRQLREAEGRAVDDLHPGQTLVWCASKILNPPIRTARPAGWRRSVRARPRRTAPCSCRPIAAPLRTVKVIVSVAPGCRVRVFTATSSCVVLEGHCQKVAWPTWASFGAAPCAPPSCPTRRRRSRREHRHQPAERDGRRARPRGPLCPPRSPDGSPHAPQTARWRGARSGAGSVREGRDHLGAHQLDGLHDRLVGHLVGVDQAEQEVDPGRLVLAAGLDALLGRPEHAGVRVRRGTPG